MHLIHVESIQLDEFFGDDIPPYAILSHRWGKPQDEVLFRDMDTARRSHKKGYEKILFLCQQAARDGLEYAWCDTCAIDKSSSAELSESINSMFRWYQNASVCYAYLDDVRSDGDRQYGLKQLGQSRWFTRGWTLQELLAPEEVKFYDRDWKYLGEKSSMVQQLNKITGINHGALWFPGALPTYSIATRMSWASKRTTTRIEDQAYCMLGILGVNIPLLYGEGQAAFKRLQEELIRASDDETIFAHSGPGVLASHVREFSSGQPLTILPKEISTPFTLTNAGLNIYMRIVDLTEKEKMSSEKDVSVLGILNCHDNDEKNRDGYLALCLEATGIENTYRKALHSLQWVKSRRASAAQYRTIFIQLQAVQISRITLLEAFDARKYHSKGNRPNSKNCIYNPKAREFRIYPTPPYEFEAIFHFFQLDGHNVTFMTFFELINHKAGVLPLPRDIGDPTHDQVNGLDAFKSWKDRGRPTAVEFPASARRPGSGETVKVSVVQHERMKQFVWLLRIEGLEDHEQ